MPLIRLKPKPLYLTKLDACTGMSPLEADVAFGWHLALRLACSHFGISEPLGLIWRMFHCVRSISFTTSPLSTTVIFGPLAVIVMRLHSLAGFTALFVAGWLPKKALQRQLAGFSCHCLAWSSQIWISILAGIQLVSSLL